MIKEIRNKSDVEIADLISKLKTQLLEIRFNHANGETSSINKVKEIKKVIAQGLTVLSERNVKLSFTTHETRIIKSDNNGQIFIPVKTKNSLSVKKASNNNVKNNNQQTSYSELLTTPAPEKKVKKTQQKTKETVRVQSKKMASNKG